MGYSILASCGRYDSRNDNQGTQNFLPTASTETLIHSISSKPCRVHESNGTHMYNFVVNQ